MDTNKFITDIKRLKEIDKNIINKSYNKIIDNLFIKNLWGVEKAMGLDEYASETNTKLTLIPGHIYAFRYKANKPTLYQKNEIKIEFYDNLPILLCFNNTPTTISGINLNFCNYALRTLILNDIYNLDQEFFKHNASEQAHTGLLPISKNITKFFMNKSNQTLFLKRIVEKYHIQNYDLIYRTYNVKNIINLRFIEPWQWQYIPFLTFKENIKTEILQIIQFITQIDKVKI